MPYFSQDYLASLGDVKRARIFTTHTPIGHHHETRDQFFIPTVDRYAGTYILGVQGVGKSRLLENLIAHDVHMDRAVIVIDPHGDLTVRCIAQLPENKIPKAYLLDMEDEKYPFGLNIFSGYMLDTIFAQSQAVDRVMHVFEALWSDILSQAYLNRYLRVSCITLLANPGTTLADMHPMLTDDSIRRQMLKNVTEPSVQKFWQTQYDNLSVSERRLRVEPLVGRLESLFMGRPLIGNIIGQRETSIHFRKSIENKEIIFIRLPLKTLPQDARLIGMFLVTQLHAALFSFGDLPENKRPGFSLYIDEFEHFVNSDVSEMFTEGRKFGAMTTACHQHRGQLPSYLQQATMTARTKICFRTTPEDAREMAHVFLNGHVAVKEEDIEPRAIEHLLKYGSDNEDVETLLQWYLRPVQSHKRGNSIEIAKPGSNMGRGFYSTFLYTLDKRTLLTLDIHYPTGLVVEGAKGLRFTRLPESNREQLYHFLFFLRSTMKHLAHYPIGKASALSTSEVARMLTGLPSRAAFVSSGEDTRVFYTDKTLPLVSVAEQRRRIYLIRDQTRVKYCKPKEEVNTDTSINNPPNEPRQFSRWQEVK